MVKGGLHIMWVARILIERGSPEEYGYDTIKNNLGEEGAAPTTCATVIIEENWGCEFKLPLNTRVCASSVFF